jgi:hypothetical protein
MSEPTDPPEPTPSSGEAAAETRPAEEPERHAEAASPGPPAEPLPSPSRPELSAARDPLYRECGGYRLRLDPPDLARLRELPGARGKTDEELGEQFFDGQAERLAASIAGDVPTPNEIRVVVDPYSRQAFLALESRIRGILSF